MGAEVVAETIRHTVATILRTRRVPFAEIETMLGHRVLKKTSAVSANYDPGYLADVRDSLTILCDEVMSSAADWDARQGGPGKTVVLRRGSPEAFKYL